jgi:hypothetical protein
MEIVKVRQNEKLRSVGVPAQDLLECPNGSRSLSWTQLSAVTTMTLPALFAPRPPKAEKITFALLSTAQEVNQGLRACFASRQLLSLRGAKGDEAISQSWKN